MYWADKIVEEIVNSGKHKPYWVDDMKTPSGFAHIGSLLGPVIHSTIYRALKKRGVEATFTYVFNNFDPVDGLPAELMDEYGKYMGFPLKLAPSPDPKFDNMADYYADDFTSAFRSLGAEPTLLSSWDMYREGKFDEVVREALDKAEKIQDIYQKVSGSAKKEAGWLPFQVICEKCGKLGTTRVYEWNGEEVGYKCEPNLVKWAQGCGHEGKVSPFGGTGKLPWKVDWAAHWKVLGVTIEGAGKDHASAGGSYDIAMELCEEVFNYPRPYKMPYEFILFGGRKMSSSKGVGLKAHDLAKIVPPTVGRFLLVKGDIKSQSNFDPVGMAIPDLFDSYDKAANAFWDGAEDKLAKAFEYSQISDKLPEKHFLPRFIDVANYLQDSKVDIAKKFEEIKGAALNNLEKETLEERIKYAKVWLAEYAPKDEVFAISKEIPEEAKALSEKQKEYLKKVSNLLEQTWEDPEELQTTLYDATKEMGIPAKEAFAAIYLVLTGKTHGPKAAWFLLENLREAKKRFEEIQTVDFKENVLNSTDENGYSISGEVKQKFSGVSFAYTIIKNVNIQKKNNELEQRKKELFEEKSKLSYDQIREIKPISVYIKMLKETGVDTGSRRPSPEALLRRLSQGKEIYNINTAVDAYNLAVVENGVGLGGFDYDKIKPPVVLRFSKEGEEMHLLGDEAPTKTKEREIVYADSEKLLTLDLNYRDIDATKITENTKNIILFADGGPDIDPGEVKNALQQGAGYIQKYCGGEIGEIKVVK